MRLISAASARQPKQSRLGIAGLRARRQRADFDEPESEREQSARELRRSCRIPRRARAARETAGLKRRRRDADRAKAANQGRKFQRRDRGPVRRLGRQAARARPARAPARSGRDHAVRSPKRWRPSVAERQRARPNNRRQRQAAHRDAGTALRRATAPILAARQARSASIATSVRSSRPLNHFSAVSGAWAAVEKWM